MKKLSFAIAFWFILAVSIPAAFAADTVPNTQSFQITSVSMKRASSYLRWDIKLKNLTGVSIDSFVLQYRFFDKYGKRLFEYSKDIEGYSQEAGFAEYLPKSPIKNKKTYTVTERYALYLTAGRISVAVQSYTTSTGRKVHLNQDQLVWYGSDKSVSTIPYDTVIHTTPDESAFAKGKTFAVGFSYYNLLEEDANYYLHEHGGEWLSEIAKGSLAEKAGLLVGDVLTSVDGKAITIDTYEFDYGKNRMAEGKSIVVEFERSGSIYVCTLSKNPEEIIPASIKK